MSGAPAGNGYLPSRSFKSAPFTPAAYTLIKTSSGCILGTGFVATVRTSGPPGFEAKTAFMVLAIF